MSARSPCESGREYVSSARECKEPSASPFKRVLAGASPVTGVNFARVAQQQRHCVEGAASAGATPVASTISGCKL